MWQHAMWHTCYCWQRSASTCESMSSVMSSQSWVDRLESSGPRGPTSQAWQRQRRLNFPSGTVCNGAFSQQTPDHVLTTSYSADRDRNNMTLFTSVSTDRRISVVTFILAPIHKIWAPGVYNTAEWLLVRHWSSQ